MSDKFIPGISQHIPIKMTWWDKLKSKWMMRKYSKVISKQAKARTASLKELHNVP